MKKRIYLIRITQGGFGLAKGEPFATDLIEGLALVRIYKFADFKPIGDYSIIDTFSGLFVLKNKSKKRLLDEWSLRLEREIIPAINRVRKSDHYKDHVIELQNQKADMERKGFSFEKGSVIKED